VGVSHLLHSWVLGVAAVRLGFQPGFGLSRWVSVRAQPLREAARSGGRQRLGGPQVPPLSAGRQTLAANRRPPNRGRGGKGGEAYTPNVKTALLLIIREIVQNAKHTTPTRVSRRWAPGPGSCGKAPGNPGPDTLVGGNGTRERTDRDLDQDRRQDSEQGPLQKPAMDEESETLVIPQL